jgi:copper homeostasis protein
MTDPILVEVCANSMASALAAQQGGANRVELCSDLLEGGITPSIGIIQAAREFLQIHIHVLIRPRGGDFCYSRDEFDVMRRDIEAARRLGVDGVVFGVLDEGGQVDLPRMRELISCARPLSVTFHRAFDMTVDLPRALEDLIQLGVERVLTSGGEKNVEEGLPRLSSLVKQAGGRISIMPGGGIHEQNIQRVLETSRAREVHFGATGVVQSRMTFRNPRVCMGSPEFPAEYAHRLTQYQRVKEMVALARQISPEG